MLGGKTASIAVMATVLLVTALISPARPAGVVRLTVDVVERPGSNGPVKVAVWRDEGTFLKGQPYRSASVSLIDGKAAAVFNDMELGEYAVSAYYDRNNNGNLDKNFIGKPAEPFGFSNDARGIFGPPKYREASFAVSNLSQTITVILK